MLFQTKQKISIFFLFIGLFFSILSFAQEHQDAVNYGGKKELKRFLQQEMNYPINAYNNKKDGTVLLSFYVDNKTGETSGLKIKTSIDSELDNEAIRLYNLLLFDPPFYKGNKEKSICSLKIKFSLKLYNKYCKKRAYRTINLNDSTIDYSMIIYNDKNIHHNPVNLFEDSLMTIFHFINKNLKYPEGTLKLNITGVVKLHYIVEPSGRITNIKVLNDVGGGATDEALRLLKLLKFKAGVKDGKKVRVAKIFEVDFNLSNDAQFNYVPSRM